MILCPATGQFCDSTACRWPSCQQRQPTYYQRLGWQCGKCGASVNPDQQTCPNCTPIPQPTSGGQSIPNMPTTTGERK